MTTSEHQPRQAETAAKWVAESIRLTFFFKGAPPESIDLWKQIAQHEPEAVVAKPAAGTKQANGPFGQGQFFIQQLPQRLDFIYGPSEPSPEILSEVPFVQIGPLQEALNLFRSKFDIMNKVQDSCTRIAFCPIAIIIGKTAAESNRVFKKFNPDFNLDPDNDTDLLLQVNNPFFSKTDPSVKVNRISKWQVAEFGLMNFTPGTEGLTTVHSASMCRLELDLSTPPSNAAVLDGARRLQYMQEFEQAAVSGFRLR